MPDGKKKIVTTKMTSIEKNIFLPLDELLFVLKISFLGHKYRYIYIIKSEMQWIKEMKLIKGDKYEHLHYKKNGHTFK